jgi:glycosyltransferase involved in cell wall biosynthesis
MPCGVGDYTASLAEALRRSGKARVAVLIGDQEGQAQPGVELFRLHGWSMRHAFAALRAAASWKPDLVHMQFPTQGYRSGWLPWIFPLLLRLSGFRVVQTWHEFTPMGLRGLPLCLAPGPAIVVRPRYVESSARWCRWFLENRRIVFVPSASSIPRSGLTQQQREELHSKLAKGQERVVSYFGFAYPHKGVELLFDIADPARDHLLLICDLHDDNIYHQTILERCRRKPWAGKVTVTGFLPPHEVGNFLSASDAVVLPFLAGAGEWNTSLQAATAQGVFLLTTSSSAEGYDPVTNVHYCRPGDAEGMRLGLNSRIGRRVDPVTDAHANWAQIADSHIGVYTELLAIRSKG